jgi:prophage regulatory protein
MLSRHQNSLIGDRRTRAVCSPSCQMRSRPPMRITMSPTKIKRNARLLSKVEVIDRIGVTYPIIWKWMLEGKFPRSVELGTKKIAWYEHEIDDWIANLPRRRLKGDAEKTLKLCQDVLTEFDAGGEK